MSTQMATQKSYPTWKSNCLKNKYTPQNYLLIYNHTKSSRKHIEWYWT